MREPLAFQVPDELVEAIAALAAELVLEQIGKGSPWMDRDAAARYLSLPVSRLEKDKAIPATTRAGASSTTARSSTPTCSASLTPATAPSRLVNVQITRQGEAMNKRDAERVARASAELEAARRKRDALIRELHNGNSIRELATAAGLSAARVHQILREEER